MKYRKSKLNETGAYENDDYGFGIVRCPFANCQIGCISQFNNILYTDSLEERKKVLKNAIKKIDKNQIIIDVNRTYEKRVEELFSEKQIVFKQQYTSTNDSLMTIYLLKTEDYLYA